MKTRNLTDGRSFWITAFAGVVALALSLLLAVQPALAAESSSSSASSRTSGSGVSSESESARVAGGLPMMGNDYVWFGNNLKLTDVAINNDLLAAGRSADVSGCKAGGGIRIAAQEISIVESSAQQNITAAAETVKMRDVHANAVAAAGRLVSFSGSCSSLVVYANKVFIDGTVNGDVVVGAEGVEVGEHARINGTLYVKAPKEPVMQNGAEVAHVEFTKSEEGASADEVGGALSELLAALTIVSVVLGLIGTLLIALLAEWLFRRHTAAAANMIRNRTGATIGSGIVGAIVAPVAIIILCVLVITLPIAGILALVLIAMSIAANGFMGASLFKLVFPRLGRYPCALAGGAIMGVAGVIPFIGIVVDVAAFVYFLGYVLQSIYVSMREPDSPSGAPVPSGTAPVTTGGAPVTPGGAPVVMGTTPVAPGGAPVSPSGSPVPQGGASVPPAGNASGDKQGHA